MQTQLELHKRPKYDKATRRKVRARVKALRKEGLRYRAIAETMNKEGFVAPDGRPLKENTVAIQMYCAANKKKRKFRKRRPLTNLGTGTVSAVPNWETPSATDTDADILVDLVLDAKISDAKKLAMIRSLRKR